MFTTRKQLTLFICSKIRSYILEKIFKLDLKIRAYIGNTFIIISSNGTQLGWLTRGTRLEKQDTM
jgi:hypothetical protein